MHTKTLKSALFFSILLFLLTFPINSIASGNKVKIKKTSKGHKLFVNSKPFLIKGVGYNGFAPKETVEKYFKLANEMGANSIRQWAVAPNENEILDVARNNGLMINLGLWVIWSTAYPAKNEEQKNNILLYVEKYKDHPALLLWNLGNEDIKKIIDEDEKIKFSKYVEEIAKKIHEIDPNHPVAYSGSGAIDMPYIKDYVPSIDIYGFNAYHTADCCTTDIEINKFKRPYILSEFGPDGWWEVGTDKNGQSKEPTNDFKAKQYYDRWKKYILPKRDCLGGYAFIINDKYEESKTWWGITHKGLKTISFWALRKAYTGLEIPDNLPKIIKLFISKKSAIKKGSIITIKIIARGENLTYDFDAPLIGGAEIKKENNCFIYKVPQNPGIYRIYGIVMDNKGNIDTVSRSIKVNAR